MNIYIISKEASQAFLLLNNELKLHGFESIFEQGVFLADESEISNLININSFISKYGRFARLGEVGCLLSHRNIYKKELFSKNKWTIVLEDDALIEADFGDKVRNIISDYQTNIPTVIILGCSRLLKSNVPQRKLLFPSVSNKKIGNVKFFKPFKTNKFGTVGYLFNSAAVNILLGNDELPSNLADDWKLYESRGIDIWHLRDYVVYEDFQNKNSSTGNKLSDIHSINKLGITRYLLIIIKNNILALFNKQ